MKRLIYSSMLALGAAASPAFGQVPILQATDPILAIDAGPLTSHSRNPDAEDPAKVLDGNVDTKYLNFGDAAGSRRNARNSGFIVTPATAGTIIQSMLLTTANDAENRDPASYAIYGTNSLIASLDDGDGQGESWTLISEGSVTLPAARKTAGSPISFANGTAYNSYRVVFPELKNFRADGLMQVADVGLFTTSDATGSSILTPAASIIAIQLPRSGANSPAAEGPEKLLDGNVATKYLNFGKENSGFIVTPQKGATVVNSFKITTANDWSPRDPASYELYGTNEAIASANFSQGLGETWTLISSGALALPGTLPGGGATNPPNPANDGRQEAGPMVLVSNTTAYASYKMVFPTMKDPLSGGADSLQISEVQFYAVPEPTALALGMLGLMTTGCLRRRR